MLDRVFLAMVGDVVEITDDDFDAVWLVAEDTLDAAIANLDQNLHDNLTVVVTGSPPLWSTNLASRASAVWHAQLYASV